MAYVSRFLSLALVAGLFPAAFSSTAQAQVGQTAAPVMADPLFKGAKQGVGGALTLTSGASVILNQRGGVLLSAVVMVPDGLSSGVSVKSTAGTATSTATAGGTSGAARAAALIGVLSGYGDGMAQPLTEFLTRADVVQRLPAGLSIDAAPFTIGAQTQGKLLKVTLAPSQANPAAFGAPAAAGKPSTGVHLLPAKKASGKPVVLRVYSDFQCPYCNQFENQTMPVLLKALPDNVAIEFHQFPLESIHPLARPSAEAAECADQQGKFWAYKDALFADRTWLEGNPNTVFNALAGRVGLNTAQFKTCLADRLGKAGVDAGVQEALRVGVNGTPTVFVGNYRAANAYDVSTLLKLINLATAAAGASASQVSPPLSAAPVTPKP